MQRAWYIIANWKMYLSYTPAVRWCIEHADELEHLGQQVHLGIAPEAVALPSLYATLHNRNVMLAGQNCSQHDRGAYTGEISAQSLYDIGCQLCIIGHSEQRAYHNETSNVVGIKAQQLLNHHITPIVCVGETQQERDAQQTESVLQQQLNPVIEQVANKEQAIMIAYEPRWAIGTGTTPSNDDIASAITYIRSYMQQHASKMHVIILYGGSVGPDNSKSLATIQELDGFLIGSASCDFQKLQKSIYSIIE